MTFDAEIVKLREEIKYEQERNRLNVQQYSDRIEAALALHYEVHDEIGLPPTAPSRCMTCRVHWPCPTVKALKGEK